MADHCDLGESKGQHIDGGGWSCGDDVFGVGVGFGVSIGLLRIAAHYSYDNDDKNCEHNQVGDNQKPEPGATEG